MRGVPIKKAKDQHSFHVWAMNGKPLENIHGGPLRLIHSGRPGSTSHKKITLRDKVHDGQGTLSASYRVAIKPWSPEPRLTTPILESMPVRSIITRPANGTKFAEGVRELKLRGAAWAGNNAVKAVDVSIHPGHTAWTEGICGRALP